MAKKKAGSLRRMFGSPPPSDLVDVPPGHAAASTPAPATPPEPAPAPAPAPPPAAEAAAPEPAAPLPRRIPPSPQRTTGAPGAAGAVEGPEPPPSSPSLAALKALLAAHAAVGDPTSLPEPRLKASPDAPTGITEAPTVVLQRRSRIIPATPPAAAPPAVEAVVPREKGEKPEKRADGLGRPDGRMSPEAKGELLLQYVARGQSVEGLPFFDASLTAARLPAANLRDSQIQRTELSRADLRGADLRGADLRGTVMRSADLRGADLRGARLELTRLEAADLRYADLREVSFARVSGMMDADLRGADLHGVEIVEQMRGARADEQTVYRSGWTALHLLAARACGLRLEGLDRLPPELRLQVEGTPDGLTLHFGTRLTFMDDYILRGAICAVVGSDTDCQILIQPEARGCAVSIQSSQQDGDLAELAEALHGRVWEREPADEAERSLIRRLFEVFPHARLINELSALVDRLERIEHRDHGSQMSWRPPVDPEAALQHLLLKLFIPVELRWWLACIPGGKQLVRELPPRDDSPEAVVAATIRTLARRERIDAALFSSLIDERPRREPEIRDVARLWGVEWYAFRDPDEP